MSDWEYQQKGQNSGNGKGNDQVGDPTPGQIPLNQYLQLIGKQDQHIHADQGNQHILCEYLQGPGVYLIRLQSSLRYSGKEHGGVENGGNYTPNLEVAFVRKVNYEEYIHRQLSPRKTGKPTRRTS